MAGQRHRVVAVAVEVLAVDHGLWCTACALPAGVAATVVVRCSSRMHMQTRRWCQDCGRTRTVAADG